MKTILATITLGSIIMVSICHAQSIRKDYNEMTEDEIEAYVDAIYELHLGIITELADYHDNNFFTLHLNEMDEDVFLAWHRMAMLEMEDSIRTIYPELSIPYWNWVTDDSENDPLWDQDFLGQFDDEQEYEDLGRTFSQFEDLPDQSDVNYVQSINTWE
ncbi:MAG: tyrosinase family protein, partial [Balneolales bacterium]